MTYSFEPEQYILEEWDSMCSKAYTELQSDCPLLEDEVLTEMHKYFSQLKAEVEALKEELRLLQDKE